MKKIFMALFVAVIGLTVSCGSKKAASELYETPCFGKEFMTDNSHFRASASGIAGNEDAARKVSTANARQELATSISAVVKAVTDNYTKNYVDAENSDTKQRFEELARTVVNQKLNGSHVICQKYRKMDNGSYSCYTCVELSSEDVLAALNSQISNETKLRTDYDYEKFKKTFEEEMAKFQ